MIGAQSMARYAALLTLCAALTGCASGTFQNRVSCTLDGREGTFCSFYGPVCIGAKIDPRDAAAMCRQITTERTAP